METISLSEHISSVFVPFFDCIQSPDNSTKQIQMECFPFNIASSSVLLLHEV